MFRPIATLTSVALALSTIGITTPAFAVNTVTYNPTSGATLSVGNTIGADIDAEPKAVGTYDVVFEQTWDNSSVVPTDVSAPLDWGVEYLVDGSWQSTAPNDLRATQGVRSVGELDAVAISNGNQQLTEQQVSGEVTPGVATIASSGRGDGWDVVLTPLYVVNVFHHNGSTYYLECHLIDTGELCDSNAAYSVSGYATSNGSGGAYYNGKVYSYVVSTATSQTGVICTNVSTLPFTSCGFTAVGASGTSSATGDLGTQATVGTKIWLADNYQNKILCFDMSTATACTSIDLGAGYAGSGNSIDSFLVNIDNLLYMVADKIYCFNPTDGSTCAGSWPVSDTAYSNVIPVRTYDSGSQTYTLSGVCAYWRAAGPACWDTSGASLAIPTGLNTLLTTAATKPAGGIGYFQTTAWTSSRVFWMSNETGATWSAGYLTCYDYATDALCADFVTPQTTTSAYAAVINDSGTCVWSNGDQGVIGSINAQTGEAGCLPPGAIAEFTFDAAPSCTATGAIISLTSLTLSLPVTVNVSDLTLKVFDSRGVFTGFDSLALTSTTVDLSTIDTTGSNGIFHYQITSSVDTVEELQAVTAAMTYVAEPLAMCVTLVVVPDCPANLSTLDGFDSFSQPDVVVDSSVTMTLAGVASSYDGSTTYTVSDYASEGCWEWESLMGPSGGLQGDANKATVVDFLWAPDGTMYVGGKFLNAGGDAAADNLAAWDGTGWSSVAPIDANTSSINERVSSLALSPDGRTLYVGGSFTNVFGDADIDNFAVLDIAGESWSAGSTSYDFSVVHDIAVDPDSGAIYVGGNFADKLVLVVPSSESVTAVGGSSAIGANVLVLEFGPDGNLYAGGEFTNAGGDADADYAAMWDGSAWTPVNSSYASNSSISAAVTSFAWGEDILYIGGLYNFVAKYSITDEQWTSLTGLGGTTRSLAVASDGTLYAAGTSAYTQAKYFARWVNGAWAALPIYNYATQALVSAANTAASYNYSSWTGAWNVDFSPTGDLWYGGDFTEINGDTSFAYLAHWGFESSFGGYAVRQNTPPGYDGPIVTAVSKRSPAKGLHVTLYGKKLGTVTAVAIMGYSAQVLRVSENEVEIVFPAELDPGSYDAVLTSSYGKLTLQDAFVFTSTSIDSANLDSFKMWTHINEAKDTVRIYAKQIVGLGKVQFFVDGHEVAWVRALDASDPKLRKVNGSDYLVRTVSLHPGKNRFEIKLNGVRVWRTTYVPEN